MPTEKPMRYSVQWDCPNCGNSHNWWWEDKREAYSEDEIEMICDRCMEPTKCRGDGNGFYEPIKDSRPADDTTAQIKTLFDSVNSLAKRLADVENMVRPAKSEPSFIDLIHGVKPPFYARFREGCQFTKEEMPPDKLASVLRFIAVEVERMTERDMGGSFTVSNLEVARQLREFAGDALVEDFHYDPDFHSS